MKKHITAHFLFAATALASQPVWALGFGRAVPDAVLGQTLVFTVPVHVEAGEHFGAECMSAEVYYGESRLLPNEVRSSVERGNSDNDWVVKVTTISPIAEPVVEIAVSAGCERRFTRRFTAFADPPLATQSRSSLARADAGVTSSAGNALAPVPAPGERSARRSTTDSGVASNTRSAARKGPTLALANELNARPAAAPRHARTAADNEIPRAPAARTGSTPGMAAPRLVLDSGFAHLKLDMEDPVVPVASTSAAAASSAAFSLTDVDDPDTRQLRALEQSIQAMRRETQTNRDQTAKLQSQLAQAQAQSDWLPWIGGLLALAVAAAAALAWKLRQQSKLQAHSAWFAESQSTKAPPMPAVAGPVYTVRPSQQDAGPSIAGEVVGEPLVDDLPDMAGNEGGGGMVDVAATRPLDRAAMAGLAAQEAAAPRELSVEELLDLEQQADFFIALGQEDAAVDLLMSHLRSAGGQSPLPYTKLLEIYRRQGDRSAYERTRARFNRRFNAYAPDWDTGPAAGRSLEDYPETVALLQAAWASPIDAMAILEGLLFKRDDTSELFDLPAYRDVLVLYSLARDLWQLEGGASGTPVDVLLPLDDADYAAFQPQTPYDSPSSLNGLDLPLDAGLTSFEMTGYQPPGAGDGLLDLEVPHAGLSADPEAITKQGELDGVHATLDAFSLAPLEPLDLPKPAGGPGEWHDHDSPPPPGDAPAPKKH